MAFNSFAVTLGLEDLDFPNTELIFHLNSMPRVCGSLETTDSTAHAISRLEHGFINEKFRPFMRTASSESVRTYLERLGIHFLEAKAGVDKTILPITEKGELTNMNHFLLINDVSE
jgi:hypothetical protein